LLPTPISLLFPFTSLFRFLIKSCAFGLILSWVGTYNGYYTSGGARGVGIATTQAVVLASIMILISNYFLRGSNTHSACATTGVRSEEHTSELQSRRDPVCR